MPDDSSCTTYDPLTAASALASELDQTLKDLSLNLKRPLREVYLAFNEGDWLTDAEVAALHLHVRLMARSAGDLGPTFRLFVKQALSDQQRLQTMLEGRRRQAS